jgi:hypothetical protein
MSPDHLTWMPSLDQAIGQAMVLTRHGGTIFIKDLDGGDWSTLS